jgi:lysophospholipase L1-like esterase
MRINDGQCVVFLGDSITEHQVAVNDWMETQEDGLPPIGASVQVQRYEHRGWAALLADRIRLTAPERRISYHNAGIGGNSSRQMLVRLDADVLAHQPHWLLLSAGVVEVRRTYQPDRQSDVVSLAEYADNLATMVSTVQSTSAAVILLEPTPHGSPVKGGPPGITLEEINALTQQYAAQMALIAQHTGAGFVPLFDAFLRTHNALAGAASLYADDVHLSPLGDLLYSQIVFDYLNQ